MTSQRFRVAPSTYLPIMLLLLFAVGAFLFGQNNLSSLQHLWRTFDHPLGQTLFPAPANNEADTSYISARLWQAEQALTDGDPERAAELIVTDVQTGNRRAVRLQGKIFEAQGNVDQALNTWQQLGDALSLLQAGEKFSADDQLTDAMRALQAAYEVDPDEGTYRLANFLWRKLEDDSRAEEILRNSIDNYTRSSNRVYWLIELGNVYLAQERWDAAEIAYGAARDIDPRRIETHRQLGRLQYQAYGDVAQAMAHFGDIIALDERRGYGQAEIANMLRREKRHTEAIPWYAAAVEREDQSAGYHYVQALNMVQSGNRAKGFELYRQTAELFPEYAPTFYQLSVLYKEDGVLSEAQMAIDKAIALSGSTVPAHFTRHAEAVETALSQ